MDRALLQLSSAPGVNLPDLRQDDVPYNTHSESKTDADGAHYFQRAFWSNDVPAARGANTTVHKERFVHIVDQPVPGPAPPLGAIPAAGPAEQVIRSLQHAEQQLALRHDGLLLHLEWRTRYQQESSKTPLQGGVSPVDHSWTNKYTVDLAPLLAGKTVRGYCEDAQSRVNMRPNDIVEADGFSTDDADSSSSTSETDSADEDEHDQVAKLRAKRRALREQYNALGMKLEKEEARKSKAVAQQAERQREKSRSSKSHDAARDKNKKKKRHGGGGSGGGGGGSGGGGGGSSSRHGRRSGRDG